MKDETYKNTGWQSGSGEIRNLSIFTGSRFFNYALFNENHTTVLEVGSREISKENFPGKSPLQVVEFLLNDYRLSSRKFKNIDVCILNSNFSILPEAFASKENAKDVIAFSSGENKILTTGTMVFNDVNFTFSVDQELQSLFERNFKQAVIRHSGAVGIHLLFTNQSLKNCDLFLNFHYGTFEIIAKNNKDFLYYNVFSTDSNEDILYYLLFMMEQYQLNPLTVKIRIGGQMPAESELVKAVKRYIRHVDFAVSDKSFNNSFAAMKMPDHFFFTTLNQHLCGS